ncbi:Ureidoglycolate lyase [hydrothermal vent metagenome]|uniref:Ureidoglycolate lyase n=1 Tax=hydrothermal vent metagenome TaxID=652676 RepID=A0A3B0SN11_9ZZZZ
MRQLIPEPLTAAAFAPYGDVVDASSERAQRLINEGHTTRFHDLADVTAAGRLTVNIFRSEARDLPVTLHQMECHPKACQMFMPLSGHPYLVVVAPKGDFDGGNIRVFLARPDQGVNYHAGTWHHYSLALKGQSDFLVLDYADMEDNCDIAILSSPIEIIL